MSFDRVAPLDADGRARLLHAAAHRPPGERLLAWLVLEEGLTLAQAVSVRGSDVSHDALMVTRKTGVRESRAISSGSADLLRRAAQQTGRHAELVAGRSGRPLSAAAARGVLLSIARQAGVPVHSVHQLRARRVAATA